MQPLVNLSSPKELAPPPKLKGFDFSKDVAFEARNTNRLLSLALFTTRLCNLRCRYCYIEGGTPLPNELSLTEYKDVILQAKDLGVKTVWVPGAGEPTLQKNLKELIDFTDSLDMWFVMFTNGMLIDDDWARFLIDRRTSVVVKFNSTTPSKQDYLAGISGAYDRIQKGRQTLLDYGFNDHYPTRMAVESVICSTNYSEIAEIFSWARDNNVFPYIETLLDSGRAAELSSLHVDSAALGRLFQQLLEIDQKDYGYTWAPVPPYVASTCDKLLYNLTVDSQGIARPCCGVHAPIGDIRKEKLSDIINSPLLQLLRHPEQSLHGTCGTCKSNECLYGCRSQAETEGDILGGNSLCWIN